MKTVLKQIIHLRWSWILFAVLGIAIYFDWSGKVDGGTTILACIILGFYYDMNRKDVQLKAFNK